MLSVSLAALGGDLRLGTVWIFLAGNGCSRYFKTGFGVEGVLSGGIMGQGVGAV